jgi:hypothetical protein
MMITAIQPIIAMHYCNDELRSLQIFQSEGNQNFCCKDSHGHDLLITGNFCCETEMMKLTTDEFQTKSELPVTRISPISIDVMGMALVNQLVTSEPDSDTFLTSLKFPPKGLYLNDVSILTYICIYRI